MDPNWLERAERPAVTALLLLGSAVLTGVRLPAAGDRALAFDAFGFVEGVLALLVLFLFLRQGVLPRPAGALEHAVLAYWLFATAVLLRMALPPPGIGYWLGTLLLAFVLLGAFGGGDRRRSLFVLGIAIAVSGAVRFAVIPFLWRNAVLPDLGPIELTGLSDWAKGLVTDYEPVLGGNEVLNVLGVALYAAALWRTWPPEPADVVARLEPWQRDRLLRALLLRTDPELLPPPEGRGGSGGEPGP